MFKFRLTRTGLWSFTFDVDGGEKQTGHYDEAKNAATLDATGELVSPVISSDLQSAFAEFRTTNPAYALSFPYNRFTDVNGAKQLYTDLLKACIFDREDDAMRAEKIFDRTMAWLGNTDFFIAPASSYYHDSFAGGLVSHSLVVAQQIRDLLLISSFSDIEVSSAVLVALLHDWAKINIYESYMKNVKNEQTGVWEPTPAYRRKDSPVPFPHGTASLYTAQRCVRLTLAESLAIVHHMGKWDAAPSTENELRTATDNYPLVHALQFADQLAITKYVR